VKQRWRDALLVTPDGLLDRDLLVETDRILALVVRSEATGADWRDVEAGGKVIFPGIIDVLQHGFGVHLYNDVTPGCVATNSELLLSHGVTGFLPSISCLPPGVLEETLGGLSRELNKARGARALGIHSEGPCFGAPGAHNPQNIQQPSAALAARMLEAADGRLKAVTVSPEVPGAEEFIRALKRVGVSIHLGHSRAAPADIPRYVSWGIDAVTHMYNVMPPLPPDGSGVHPFSLPDALLAERNLALGLICDGIHVHPKLVSLLAQLPADRVFLETDANKFAGTEGAEFEFYPGYWVHSIRGGAVRDRDGGLCGSSLSPDEAMHNYMRLGGVDLVQAAKASSQVPARILGMENDLGSIAAGKLADFAVLDAGTLTLEATCVGGEVRYNGQDREAA